MNEIFKLNPMKNSAATMVAAVGPLSCSSGRQILAKTVPAYRSETDIVHGTIAGKQLKFNAFLPASSTTPVPAIVGIYGGWWFGGDAATPEGAGGWQAYMRRGLAVFSTRDHLSDTAWISFGNVLSGDGTTHTPSDVPAMATAFVGCESNEQVQQGDFDGSDVSI